MRKINCILLVTISSLLLSSCVWHENHRVDIFFECNLFLEQNDITYNLKIEKINEQAFLNAKGLNVVKDEVATERNLENKYYFISFRSVDSDQNETKYDFYNLQQVTKTKKEKISYKDDLNHYISPSNYYLGSNYAHYVISLDSTYILIGDIPE